MSRNIFDNYYNFNENFVDETNGEEGFDDESEFERDEEESETIPCPQCGEEIYEDAEICPKCGNYVVKEDRRSSRPGWVVITAAILLTSLLLFGIARLF